MAHGDLRKRLEAGPCFGPFLKLPRPEVVDLLKQAGFDFVIVDMEHGQISEIEARTVILACAAAGLPAVVRLPDTSSGIVNRLLEAGAVGIQMPKVRARADADRLRSMMHFPPEGIRSIGVANQWAQYGAVPIPRVVQEANARSVAIGMFETKDFADPMEEILKPLDVVFIGPGDLSIEFGAPADHPDVQAHIRKIEEAARDTDTILGFAASTPPQAAALAARGYRYIALSNDVSMLGGAAKGLLSALNEARQTAADAAAAR
jgi:2-keto-3-deoxy-L-rhamnonate aldolase RhmA